MKHWHLTAWLVDIEKMAVAVYGLSYAGMDGGAYPLGIAPWMNLGK